MKPLKNTPTLYSRLALITSVTLVVGYFVVYAAWSSLTVGEVGPGATITTGLMTKIKDNFDDLDTRVTNLTATVVASSIWSKVGNDINYTAGKVGVGATTGNAELDIQSGIKPHWGIYHDSTSEQLRFWNGDNRVVIGSTGNVGIGTVSPLRALHVKSAAGTAQIESTGTSGTLYFSDATSSVIDNQGIGSRGNNVAIMAGGTDKFTVLSTGNVGVGTTTPAQKLSVAGTIESTSGGFKFPDGTTQATSASSSSVPTGAVMAFNLAACPTGWTALASAAGKTIVGLNVAETEFNTLLKTGGEKTHIITVAEMPSHSHTYYTSGVAGASSVVALATAGQVGRATISAGSSTAHNNLQPYITLLYCQKD